jgi:hypothetical protein
VASSLIPPACSGPSRRTLAKAHDVAVPPGPATSQARARRPAGRRRTYAPLVDFADDADAPPPPGGRQVLRLVAPVFVASALVVVVGLLLIAHHHSSIGVALVVVGAIGGFAVRARLVIRSQQGPPGP